MYTQFTKLQTFRNCPRCPGMYQQMMNGCSWRSHISYYNTVFFLILYVDMYVTNNNLYLCLMLS